MDWNEHEEMMAEEGGRLGDPRRCPIHGTVISSPDGRFDGLCGACEAAADADQPAPDDGEVHLILCEPGPRSAYGFFCEAFGRGTWNASEATCQACRAEYQRWLQACAYQNADRATADDIPF